MPLVLTGSVPSTIASKHCLSKSYSCILNQLRIMKIYYNYDVRNLSDHRRKYDDRIREHQTVFSWTCVRKKLIQLKDINHLFYHIGKPGNNFSVIRFSVSTELTGSVLKLSHLSGRIVRLDGSWNE